MTFVVSIHRQICMDNLYVDEKQIKLFVHIFYNPSCSSSLAEALLFYVGRYCSSYLTDNYS